MRVRRVDEVQPSDWEQADRIALGGSIHAGTIQKAVSTFVTAHREVLLRKPLALFIACLNRENAAQQLELAFPQDLRDHAACRTCIGGEVRLSNLPFFLRPLIKVITKTEQNRLFDNPEGRAQLAAFARGVLSDGVGHEADGETSANGRHASEGTRSAGDAEVHS